MSVCVCVCVLGFTNVNQNILWFYSATYNLTIRFTVSHFPLQFCVAERKVYESAVIWNGHVCQNLQKNLNNISAIK